MLLLVGASVRALMESAAASGYEVMGIDFFGDVDAHWRGKMVSLVQDYGLKPTVKNLLEVARSIPCDGLVYASGPENSPEGLAYWEEAGLLRGNGASILTKARNPWRLCQSLKQISVGMPRFYSVKQWKGQDVGGKWLLKPLHRGGGHGIRELSEQEEEVHGLMMNLPHPAQYIVEEYIRGIPGSVTFLGNGRDAILLGTSRQLIGRGGGDHPFIYQGNIVPLNLRDVMAEKVMMQKCTKMVEHLTRELGLKGINTLDFILNKAGIWVLEINPRWSASVELIERQMGKSLFPHHLAACQGVNMSLILQELFPSETNKSKYFNKTDEGREGFFGKIIVYADAPLVFRIGDEKKLTFLYEQGLRDIPQPGTKIERGQPICSVLAEGTDDPDCLLRLQEKSDWVRQFLRSFTGEYR